MANIFQLGIYSSAKTVYEGEAIYLSAPSQEGYLGVLAFHAPLAARLKPGIITFKDGAGLTKSIQAEQEGYLEVLGNKATILLK